MSEDAPDVRAAFEAWAAQFHYALARSDCNSDQPYVSDFTDWSWLAWQEAWRAGRNSLVNELDAVSPPLPSVSPKGEMKE